MTGIRTTTLATAVLGLGLLLGGCASPTAKSAASVAAAPVVTAVPQVTTSAPAAPAVQAVPAAQVAPVAQVAAVVPIAPVSTPPTPSVATTTETTPPPATTPTSASASPVAHTPASGPVPHFTTPDAAMRYLVAAYNSGNETAIRHVTTPDSRSQFESERQWVQTFRFRSCTANGAPGWDFNCVLDIIATVPGVSPDIDPSTGLPIMDEVAVLVAPAARTGYYLAANEGCGG